MDLNIPDIVWAIVNFFILLAILNKFLHKPILDMLNKRENFVNENLNNSKIAREEAEKLRADYENQLKSAKQEANEIILQASQLGEKTKAEIIDTAKEETNKISAKAQQDIRLEKKKALAEVKEIIAETAILAAEKIVARSLNAQDHEKLIDDFVKEVGETH